MKFSNIWLKLSNINSVSGNGWMYDNNKHKKQIHAKCQIFTFTCTIKFAFVFDGNNGHVTWFSTLHICFSWLIGSVEHKFDESKRCVLACYVMTWYESMSLKYIKHMAENLRKITS